MNKTHDGLEVIREVPGVEGINQFIDCAERCQLDAKLIHQARKASRTFQVDLKLFARSHAGLKKKLGVVKNNKQAQYVEPSAEQNRQGHYEASAALLGERSELTFATFIATPNRHDSDYYQEFALVSRRQVSIKKQGRPFMQYYSQDALGFVTEPNIQSGAASTANAFELGIVERFSSVDLKDAYSGYSEPSSSLVFRNLSSSETPFDASFIFNNPKDSVNPLTGQFDTTAHSISIKIPTKRLVMLVFMDKQYDRRSSVNVGCYPYSVQVDRSQHNCDEIWNDRLPEFPELKIIAPVGPFNEILQLDCADEMVAYLFDYAGLDPAQFGCYLMDVRYPIWSSTYRVYFEFG